MLLEFFSVLTALIIKFSIRLVYMSISFFTTVKHPEPTDKSLKQNWFQSGGILESVRTFSAPGWSPGGTGCLAVSQQWSGRRGMLWRGWGRDVTLASQLLPLPFGFRSV